MTTPEPRSSRRPRELDAQVIELIAMLSSRLVSDLDPHLAEYLRKAIADVRLHGQAALANQTQIAIGDTYLTLVEMLDGLTARLAGVHQDAAAWHEETDAATAMANDALDVLTAAIAAANIIQAALVLRIGVLEDAMSALVADTALLKQYAARKKPRTRPLGNV